MKRELQDTPGRDAGSVRRESKVWMLETTQVPRQIFPDCAFGRATVDGFGGVSRQ